MLSCVFILFFSFPRSRTQREHCLLGDWIFLWSRSRYFNLTTTRRHFIWVFRVPRGSFMILWTPWHFVFPISKSNNFPWRTLWSMTEYLETTINFAASHCSWRRMNPRSVSDQVLFLLLLPPGQSNLLKNFDELCSKRFLAATDAKTHADAD